MSKLGKPGAMAAMYAAALLLLAASQPFTLFEGRALYVWSERAWLLAWCALLGASIEALRPVAILARTGALTVAIALGAAALLWATSHGDVRPAAGFWLSALALLALAIVSIRRWTALESAQWLSNVPALLFGAWVLVFWQLATRALQVPSVLLPAPADIAMALMAHAPTLAGDFTQTILRSVLAGYFLGCGLGIAVAIAIDRAPFLQRGLLPLASLTGTIPLVGVAPIAVRWFGFDWPSKAAVIVLMTFFPALISTLAGLQATGRLERELMHSYAAGYRRTLLDLRLPTALPFIFSALKVNATLSLIGAIVAEFFGSPTSGLGFRISTEAARMNMPLVWAAIVVAAATGSLLYALLIRLERRVNFWHPSVRHP